MKFIKAYIDGYGKYHNVDIDFEPGFNLVYGPNEAGKTTMMSFLRTIFFGFPGKKSAIDRYEPLSGGTHGGRLELETSDKKRFTVYLKPGRKLTGDITILNADGTELSGESAIKSLQVALHGISENIYKSVFAFSLTELQRLDTLQNDEINAHIYSAGTGVGDVTLPEILSTVDEEKNRIYKYGGTAQLIPKITRELERVRTEISAIKKDLERYKTTITEIEALSQEQATLSHVIEDKRREREKASKLKAGRDNVNELNEIEKQISSFPFVTEGFPSDGSNRLDKLEDKSGEKSDELQECKDQINDLRSQSNSILINTKVLESESLIVSLFDDRSAEIENIKREDDIKIKTTMLKTDISNAVNDLGTDWDEDHVKALDTGKETLQNIRVLAEDLSNARVNVEMAENNLSQARKNREDSSREFKTFSSKLNKTRPVINLKFLLIFGIPIVALSGTFCWMTFKPISGIMATVLGILSIAALYYVYYKSSTDTLEESKKQLSDIQESKRQYVEEVENALINTNTGYHQALTIWQDWLKNNGFSTELDSNGIFTLIESIKKAKELIRDKVNTEKELEYIRERACTFNDRVNNVLKLCSLKETSLRNISQSIHRLDDTLTKQKNFKGKREHLEEKTKELETREKTIHNHICNIEKNIKDLIAEGDVKNSEEFRKQADIAEKKASLLERKNTLDIQLARLIGSAHEIQKFKEDVAAETDPTKTDQSVDKLEEEITQMESKHSGLMHDLGAKRNQISELEKSEKLGGLRLEEENLKAQLRKVLSGWSVNALCHTLLKRSMTIYERERQPYVLKHAGQYLNKITRRRYVHVIKKSDGNKLVVETPEGLQKSVTELSRGTAEQLYLSMRLAFIKEYAKRVGALPLIVDDILVNFDSQRAKTTIRLLNEISGENQIIMFTCHPHTLDLCKSEIKDFKGPVTIDA